MNQEFAWKENKSRGTFSEGRVFNKFLSISSFVVTLFVAKHLRVFTIPTLLNSFIKVYVDNLLHEGDF